MSGFRTFVIQVTVACPLACDYCDVIHRADVSAGRFPRRMSLETARLAARRIAEHAIIHDLPDVNIVFHGGEPLHVGLSHFDRLSRLFDQYISPVTRIRFAAQTNGTLITENWLDLFQRHAMAVGVSLDGPPRANDRHRLSGTRRSTAAATERGISLLRSRPGLLSGILAVIDLFNDPSEVYQYLASFDPPTIDFKLPLATHDDPPARGDPRVPEYGRWLAAVFDAWLARGAYQPSVRILEDIVALCYGVRGSVESLGLARPGAIVIEPDGGLADTSVPPGVWGSAAERLTIADGFDDPRVGSLLAALPADNSGLSDICLECGYVMICGGGSVAHRYDPKNRYRNPSVYCGDMIFVIKHLQSAIGTWRDMAHLRVGQ